MLGHRLRRWPNIKRALDECIVFAVFQVWTCWGWPSTTTPDQSFYWEIWPGRLPRKWRRTFKICERYLLRGGPWGLTWWSKGSNQPAGDADGGGYVQPQCHSDCRWAPECRVLSGMYICFLIVKAAPGMYICFLVAAPLSYTRWTTP